jgi:triosephosphate isomerase
MARKFFVGGNFKMNPASLAKKKEIVAVLNEATLDPAVGARAAPPALSVHKMTSRHAEVVVAPPTLYLLPLKEIARKEIALAAQNCYSKPSGAFTGEVRCAISPPALSSTLTARSATQLQDAGIPFVLAGHSERRTLFHESSAIVAEKTRAALDAGLSVILCIGETLAEREAGETDAVCCAQLQPVVAALKEDDWKYVRVSLPTTPSRYHPYSVFSCACILQCSLRLRLSRGVALTRPRRKIVIAYEPVWAIGTGKVASAAQAQAAHADVRKYLSTAVSPAVADATRIIYGGSVSGANCRCVALSRARDEDMRELMRGAQRARRVAGRRRLPRRRRVAQARVCGHYQRDTEGRALKNVSVLGAWARNLVYGYTKYAMVIFPLRTSLSLRAIDQPPKSV